MWHELIGLLVSCATMKAADVFRGDITERQLQHPPSTTCCCHLRRFYRLPLDYKRCYGAELSAKCHFWRSNTRNFIDVSSTKLQRLSNSRNFLLATRNSNPRNSSTLFCIRGERLREGVVNAHTPKYVVVCNIAVRIILGHGLVPRIVDDFALMC